MEIVQEEHGHRGRFYIGDSDEPVAELVYKRVDAHNIIIEHTEVDLSLKGQGVGFKLVDAAVSWARANAIKIVPLCAFVKMVFERKPDYQDVLAAGQIKITPSNT